MNQSMQDPRNGRAVSVLDDFFARQEARTSAATQKRYAKVQQHLLSFLDEGDMSRLLDCHELAALSASRKAGQGFFGAMGLEAAIACLPRFLTQDWLLESSTDARAQVVLTGRLISWLDRAGHLDHDLLGCALYEAEAAVRAAKKAPRAVAAPGNTPLADPAVDPAKPRLTLIPGGLTPS